MDTRTESRPSRRDVANAETPTFSVEIEETTLACPTGERYAEERMRESASISAARPMT